MIEIIKSVVNKNPTLSLKINKTEYRITKSNCKGSLWIGNWKGKRFVGTRIQTTGEIASILNNDIESLESSNYVDDPKDYKYWYVENPQDIENLINIFGKK